jgi:hypothetical protein
MSEEHAVMRTGSGILVNIPVFKTMRASYRWMALCFLTLWLLCLMGLSSKVSSRCRRPVVALLFVSILLYAPNPAKAIGRKIEQRDNFRAIDRDLTEPLRQSIAPGASVAFVPWGNDFILNYCAPRAGLRTYNIGGDKNMEMARNFWPAPLRNLGWNLHAESVSYAMDLLRNGHADVLVVPFFDTMNAAFFWSKIGGNIVEERQRHEPFMQAMKLEPGLIVEDRGTFAVIRKSAS